MINSQDIKKGTCIRMDGKLYFCIDFLHRKPGKGNTIMSVTLKDVVTGNVLERRFNIGEKLEDVRVKPRYREFGFFALVPTSDTTEVCEPAGGTGLVGSCDWRHMSMTFKTGDNPKFRPYIRFRLLSGRGRVEVEDVTIEEMEK